MSDCPNCGSERATGDSRSYNRIFCASEDEADQILRICRMASPEFSMGISAIKDSIENGVVYVSVKCDVDMNYLMITGVMFLSRPSETTIQILECFAHPEYSYEEIYVRMVSAVCCGLVSSRNTLNVVSVACPSDAFKIRSLSNIGFVSNGMSYNEDQSELIVFSYEA